MSDQTTELTFGEALTRLREARKLSAVCSDAASKAAQAADAASWAVENAKHAVDRLVNEASAP